MSYTLIDPPVNAYSTKRAINRWLVELRHMTQNEQVKDAIAQAEKWLADSRR